MPWVSRGRSPEEPPESEPLVSGELILCTRMWMEHAREGRVEGGTDEEGFLVRLCDGGTVRTTPSRTMRSAPDLAPVNDEDRVVVFLGRRPHGR